MIMAEKDAVDRNKPEKKVKLGSPDLDAESLEEAELRAQVEEIVRKHAGEKSVAFPVPPVRVSEASLEPIKVH